MPTFLYVELPCPPEPARTYIVASSKKEYSFVIVDGGVCDDIGAVIAIVEEVDVSTNTFVKALCCSSSFKLDCTNIALFVNCCLITIISLPLLLAVDAIVEE